MIKTGKMSKTGKESVVTTLLTPPTEFLWDNDSNDHLLMTYYPPAPGIPPQIFSSRSFTHYNILLGDNYPGKIMKTKEVKRYDEVFLEVQ